MLRVFEILSWEQWEMFEESQVWEWHHQIGVLQRMLPSFLWFHLSQHKTRSQAFLPWSITSSLLLSPLKGLLHTVTKQTEKNRQAQALEIWCYHSRFKSFNDFPMPPGYNPNPLPGFPRLIKSNSSIWQIWFCKLIVERRFKNIALFSLDLYNKKGKDLYYICI